MKLDELKMALALVFGRKGADTMTRQQAVMGMSVELRWFLPGVAEQVVDAGIEAGLLNNGGGELRPTFDIKDVEVPLDFRPSDNIIAITKNRPPPPPPDLFMQIVDELVDATVAVRSVGPISAVRVDSKALRGFVS